MELLAERFRVVGIYMRSSEIFGELLGVVGRKKVIGGGARLA